MSKIVAARNWLQIVQWLAKNKPANKIVTFSLPYMEAHTSGRIDVEFTGRSGKWDYHTQPDEFEVVGMK